MSAASSAASSRSSSPVPQAAPVPPPIAPPSCSCLKNRFVEGATFVAAALSIVALIAIAGLALQGKFPSSAFNPTIIGLGGGTVGLITLHMIAADSFTVKDPKDDEENKRLVRAAKAALITAALVASVVVALGILGMTTNIFTMQQIGKGLLINIFAGWLPALGLATAMVCIANRQDKQHWVLR